MWNILIMVFALATPTSAQEPSSSETSQAEDVVMSQIGTPGSVEDSGDKEEINDADLDDQTYQTDDDDFVPTEEIPADKPIPFPSNI